MRLLGDLLRVSWELPSRVLREPHCFKAGSTLQGQSLTMPYLRSAFRMSKLSAALVRKWGSAMAGLVLAEPFPVKEVGSGEMKT